MKLFLCDLIYQKLTIHNVATITLLHAALLLISLLPLTLPLLISSLLNPILPYFHPHCYFSLSTHCPLFLLPFLSFTLSYNSFSLPPFSLTLIPAPIDPLSLTSICDQVNFNEPLSFLQRLTEDMEYSDLLTKAAMASTVEESLSYLSALAVSSYATTSTRTSKPFNPLLGETFEYDRTDDLGWRSLAEQVVHDILTS